MDLNIDLKNLKVEDIKEKLLKLADKKTLIKIGKPSGLVQDTGKFSEATSFATSLRNFIISLAPTITSLILAQTILVNQCVE